MTDFHIKPRALKKEEVAQEIRQKRSKRALERKKLVDNYQKKLGLMKI